MIVSREGSFDACSCGECEACGGKRIRNYMHVWNANYVTVHVVSSGHVQRTQLLQNRFAYQKKRTRNCSIIIIGGAVR